MSAVHRNSVRQTPLAAAILMVLPGFLHAATIRVNDTTEGSVDGKCTLLDAVVALNSASAMNACAAGDGINDTIDFSFFTAPTTISFTVLPIDGLSALPLAKPARLIGPLNTDGNPLVSLTRSTISGTPPTFRLISTTSNLEVDGLSLTSGSAPDKGGAILASGYANVVISNSVIKGNSAATSGGGVAVDCGNLTLTNSLVTANTALSNGGGIYAADDLNHNPNSKCAGTVTLTHSTLSDNTAIGGSGGGAYLFKGYLNVAHSIVEGNAAPLGAGGGGWLFGHTTLYASTISGNSCQGLGGGIFSNFIVKANASTFSNNTAGTGGAISGKYAQLNNVTVSGNNASSGGGVYAILRATYTTISDNHATDGSGGVKLLVCTTSPGGSCTTYSGAYSSIIAGNQGDDIVGNPSAVFLAVSNHNIINKITAAATPPDTLNCDPKLGPLANNGGPTLTMLPAAGSCAINAGLSSPPSTIATDQRGEAFLRKAGAASDIGAIEVQTPGERVFYDGFDVPS
jgi:predicted outer membrane repeat protein